MFCGSGPIFRAFLRETLEGEYELKERADFLNSETHRDLGFRKGLR